MLRQLMGMAQFLRDLEGIRASADIIAIMEPWKKQFKEDTRPAHPTSSLMVPYVRQQTRLEAVTGGHSVNWKYFYSPVGWRRPSPTWS